MSSKKQKKLSYSFFITFSLLIFISVGFLFYVYFKTSKNEVNLNKIEVEVVDSLSLIRQKDSIIEVLNNDNSRLKDMYDHKHDTVFVPKVIYRIKEPKEPEVVPSITITDN